MTANEIFTLPKIELHCHLDGSLSREFLQTRLGRVVSEEELSVTQDCKSLAEYLKKFELPGICLKDEKGISEAGYDVLRTMSSENVCYAEIRFAPLLSVTNTMKTEQVIESLLKGLKRGREEFGIDYNVITCAMRHHSEEENYKMIKAARSFLGEGVCAADLAGAEAQYPMSEFMGLFQKVKALDMPFTIHAGECGSVSNICDAVKAGAKRIGHGIAMKGNPIVQTELREARVGIEMCPISNWQTKSITNIGDYPIKEFLNAGLLVTVNTDNRTVSDTSITKEIEYIQNLYNICDEEIVQMMKNAIEVSFANDDIKNKLCRLIK